MKIFDKVLNLIGEHGNAFLAARRAAAAQREEPKTTFFGSAP